MWWDMSGKEENIFVPRNWSRLEKIVICNVGDLLTFKVILKLGS